MDILRDEHQTIVHYIASEGMHLSSGLAITSVGSPLNGRMSGRIEKGEAHSTSELLDYPCSTG